MVLAVYVLAGVAALLFLYLVWKHQSSPEHLSDIPGPRGWPILGNLPQLWGRPVHEVYYEWSKVHGPVYRIRVLGRSFVVVCSYEGIQEALVTKGKTFAGRGKIGRSIRAVIIEGMDIPLSNRDIVSLDYSPFWKKTRMGAHKLLKVYGTEVHYFEENVQSITKDLVNAMANHEGRAFDCHDMIYQTLSALMCTLLSGRYLTMSDPMVLHSLMMDRFLNSFSSPFSLGLVCTLYRVAPWLVYIPTQTSKLMLSARQYLALFFKEVHKVQETEEFKAGKGLLAAFHKMKDESAVRETNPEMVMTVSDVNAVVHNLMVGGIVTTTSSLYSLINILLHYPEVQTKMAAEIRSTVGRGRVCLADKERLPYTRAVVLETLRYTDALPAMMHATMEECQLQGHHLPKGTGVMVNFWALHHSEEYWDEPWTFKPERFLDDQGQVLPVDDPVRKRWMPFSAGPRVCVGEQFAHNRFFLLLATLVQTFQFLPPEGESLVPCDPRTYQVKVQLLVSRPYKVRAVLRDGDALFE